MSFNPHTHAGCDELYDIVCDWLSVSIHTPTQGVTRKVMFRNVGTLVSIHTPTQGVTRRDERYFSVYIVSIHTPTQGVT